MSCRKPLAGKLPSWKTNFTGMLADLDFGTLLQEVLTCVVMTDFESYTGVNKLPQDSGLKGYSSIMVSLGL